MNRPASIVSMLIVGAVLLAVGFGAGIYYNMPQLQKTETLVKNLSSKTVPSMVAYGQVSAIEGRMVTLTYGGDSLTLDLPDSVAIYSFVTGSTGQPTQEKVSFDKIKKGDNLNVTMRLTSEGDIQAQQAFILLPTPAPAQ